ncbi:MAG: class II glutamine amidotransferase [Candidatus Nitrospinota bacterium M3_3B_026]
MCGIFGYVGKSSWRTSLLLQQLCIADEVRGRHSTGLVIQSREDDHCYLMKRALSGSEFVAEGHTGFLFGRKYRMALGHNRFATLGEVNNRNAHPFGFRVGEGWNFGVHNGVIGSERTVKTVAMSFGVKTTPDVDSEVAFWSIAKLVNRGMDTVEAIDKVTERISAVADFSFAYMDTERRCIYLWRSPDRPLWVFDARCHGLGRWFCSTEDIFFGAWRSIRGALGDPKEVKSRELTPYRLYRMGRDGLVRKVKDLSHRPRREPETRPAGLSTMFGIDGREDEWAWLENRRPRRKKSTPKEDERLFEDRLLPGLW